MKTQKTKISNCIYIIIMFFIIIIFNPKQVYSTSEYTVINSQTLLASNDLDNLKLNITTLPSVSVIGSAKYTIADSGKFTPSNVKVRSVTFKNVSSRRQARFSCYCQI